MPPTIYLPHVVVTNETGQELPATARNTVDSDGNPLIQVNVTDPCGPPKQDDVAITINNMYQIQVGSKETGKEAKAMEPIEFNDPNILRAQKLLAEWVREINLVGAMSADRAYIKELILSHLESKLVAECLVDLLAKEFAKPSSLSGPDAVQVPSAGKP